MAAEVCSSITQISAPTEFLNRTFQLLSDFAVHHVLGFGSHNGYNLLEDMKPFHSILVTNATVKIANPLCILILSIINASH